MEESETVIPVGGGQVTGLWLRPEGAKAAYLLAHGAGAGMRHRAMVAAAEGLAGRGIATLRFQFPYMEKGSKRPDAPAIAQAAVRTAAEAGARLAPELPWFAGGRSFGGRMTAQAQAEAPLPGVRGLIFLGFPLHPAGKPGTARAEPLARVQVPMLFLSGTCDALAETDLLRVVVEGLGARSTLHLVEGADHGFKVLVRSGLDQAEVEAGIWDRAAAWMERLAKGEGPAA